MQYRSHLSDFRVVVFQYPAVIISVPDSDLLMGILDITSDRFRIVKVEGSTRNCCVLAVGNQLLVDRDKFIRRNEELVIQDRF